MTNLKLTKAESILLTEAAGRPDGAIVPPGTVKPSSLERMIGRLSKAGLILAVEGGGEVLIAAGYRAVGLEPPRAVGSKKEQVIRLLGREDGATLDELVAATGWLAHTTRAFLSRLRSGGVMLARSTRDDRTAYRIEVAEEPVRKTRRREAAGVGVAAAHAEAVAA